MGISINLHVYPRKELVKDIDKFVIQEGGYREGALQAGDFLKAVGDEFGRLTEDEFLVVWNEYYEDYNPGTNFLRAVDEYYFPNRDEDGPPTKEYIDRTGRQWYDSFWSSNYETASEGANAHEVLSEVFEDEFGYEGKFSNE